MDLFNYIVELVDYFFDRQRAGSILSFITLIVAWYKIEQLKKSIDISKIDVFMKIEKELREASDETVKAKASKEANMKIHYLRYLNVLDRFCFYILVSGLSKKMKHEYASWIQADFKNKEKMSLIETHKNEYRNILKVQKLWRHRRYSFLSSFCAILS